MSVEIRVCTGCFQGEYVYRTLRDGLQDCSVCQSSCLGGCAFQTRVDVVNGKEKTSLAKIPCPTIRVNALGESPTETVRGYLTK